MHARHINAILTLTTIPDALVRQWTCVYPNYRLTDIKESPKRDTEITGYYLHSNVCGFDTANFMGIMPFNVSYVDGIPQHRDLLLRRFPVER